MRRLKPLPLVILLVLSSSSLTFVHSQSDEQISVIKFQFDSLERDWSTLELLYYEIFHNSSQLIEEYSRIETTAPNLIEYEQIGTTTKIEYEQIGTTTNDIPIFSLVIGNELNTQQKPKMIVVSNHHARELITDEITLRFVLELINGYGTDYEITELLDNMEIHIIPNINADSRDLVLRENKQWLRKNLVPFDNDGDGQADEDGPDDVNENGIIECYDVFLKEDENDENPTHVSSSYECTYFEGIDNDGDGLINEDHAGYTDLNRNYDDGWGGPGSDPTDPKSQVYSGIAPFSEIETQVVRDFVANHRYTWGASIHSGINATWFPNDNTGHRHSLHDILLGDLLSILPSSFGDWLNGEITHPSHKEHLHSAQQGLWRSHMETARETRAPFTFEVYRNASSNWLEPATHTTLVDNSTHLIIESSSIFGYFNPEVEYIEDLYEDLWPAFEYMMATTPILEIEIQPEVDTSRLNLVIDITNPSTRIVTDNLNVTVDNVIYGTVDAVEDDIVAIVSVSDFLDRVSNGDVIKVGNDYEGYFEFTLNIPDGFEISGEGFLSFSIPITLGLTMIMCVILLKKRRKL